MNVRREITYLDDEMRIEDLIEEEDVVITISHLGYIKRTSATEYRHNAVVAVEPMGGSTREEDLSSICSWHLRTIRCCSLRKKDVLLAESVRDP